MIQTIKLLGECGYIHIYIQLLIFGDVFTAFSVIVCRKDSTIQSCAFIFPCARTVSVVSPSKTYDVISDVAESLNSFSGNGSALEDQLSMFSIDQEGFYTSMHADSGLTGVCGRSSTATLVPEVSEADETDTSSTDKTSHVDEKSLTAGNSSDVKLDTKQHLAVTSSPAAARTTATTECSTTGKRDAADSRSAGTRSHGDSAAATSYLSLVTITPPGSDEEDGDLLEWRNEWRRTAKTDSVQLELTLLTAPLSVNSSDVSGRKPAMPFESTPAWTSFATISGDVKCSSRRDDVSSDAGFSTWPCSPVLKLGSESAVRGILKSSSSGSTAKSKPKVITFSPIAKLAFSSWDDKDLEHLKTEHLNADLSASQQPQQQTDDKVKCIRTICCQTMDDGEAAGDLVTKQQPILAPSRTASSADNQPEIQRQIQGCFVTSDSLKFSQPVSHNFLKNDAVSLATEPASVSARLVISAPVSKLTSYVENYHRRLICRSVAPEELAKFASCSNPANCCCTLPLRKNDRASEWQTCAERTRSNSNSFTSFAGMSPIRESPEFSSKSPAHRNRMTSQQQVLAEVYGDVGQRALTGYGYPGGRHLMDIARPKSCLYSPETERLNSDAISSYTTLRSLKQKSALAAANRKAGRNDSSVCSEIVSLDRSPKKFSSDRRVTMYSTDSRFVPGSAEKTKKKSKKKIVHKNRYRVSSAECCIQSERCDAFANANAASGASSFVQSVREQQSNASSSAVADSAAVVRQLPTESCVSICKCGMTCSNDSISSTLSAAERSRAAKLAFLGLNSDGCSDAAGASVHQPASPTGVVPVQLLRVGRTTDVVVSAPSSCSSSASSGLGSSVSASPMESPSSDCVMSGSVELADRDLCRCGDEKVTVATSFERHKVDTVEHLRSLNHGHVVSLTHCASVTAYPSTMQTDL
jgi:hypothetical protein